jgi:hypothetical protein
MSRAFWSSNNIYKTQFPGCLLVKGEEHSWRAAGEYRMVERKELRWKTGAIASLEGPEFLRFAFGRGGVDASMKLTPDATDTIPRELFNQHCNSRKDPSSNFKTHKLKVHLFLHIPIEKVRSLRWTWCF